MHLVQKMLARRCKPWEPICQLGKVNSLNKFAKYFSSPPQILNVSPHLHQILGGPPHKALFWNKMKTQMMGMLWHVEPPALIEEPSSLNIEAGRWKMSSMKNSCIYLQSIYIELAHRKNRAGRQRKVTRPMITKVSFPYLIFFFFNFLWCRSNDQFCGQRSYAVRLSTNVSVIFTFWFCAGDFKNAHKRFCKIDFFNS